MGLFNKTAGAGIANSKVSQFAVDIVKQLSGSNVEHSKKLADNIVAICGTAGGTGASTVTSNVAYIASKMGLRVLVIDLNIICPAQHAQFGVEQKIAKNDLVNCLLGSKDIKDCIETAYDVSILYANNRRMFDLINCESEAAVGNMVALTDYVRPLFDLVVIDCPMRPDSLMINTAMYQSDKIYFVWDEGLQSISNTDRYIRVLSESGIRLGEKVNIILNKRTTIHYSMYPFKKMNVELVAVLPFDTSVIESSLNGEVFSAKAASFGKAANALYDEFKELTYLILKNGGYLGE